ncbi:hypothetical protein UlMin_006264 [Ulmus minor]
MFLITDVLREVKKKISFRHHFRHMGGQMQQSNAAVATALYDHGSGGSTLHNAALLVMPTMQSWRAGFIARCQSEGSRLKGCEKDLIGETNSLSREFLGTSIQVQMGNSVDIFSVQDERTDVSCRAQQKEDWDDSTIGSNISKLRIQNRLEASTRRERALAYAFSQLLRIFPKKRGVKLNAREPNMGWSWLERWMATRLPKSSSVESHTNKQVEPIYREAIHVEAAKPPLYGTLHAASDNHCVFVCFCVSYDGFRETLPITLLMKDRVCNKSLAK